MAACAVQTSPRLAGDAQPTTAAPAPTTEVAAAETTTAAPTRSPAPTRTAAARPKPPPAEPYYRNCTAARAAGAAPIRRGEPGYRRALDADNDGIACEADGGGVPATAPPPTTGEVYYANCTAARDAGAAPIRRGEPGYRPALDRDNDGIACE